MDEQFNGVCLLLKQGDFSQANQLANTLLIEHLDDKFLISAINACSFWNNFFSRISGITDNTERADAILLEWKNFLNYRTNPKIQLDSNIEYCVKFGVFSTALKHYSQIPRFDNQKLEADNKRKAGLCYKQLGEYVTAAHYLSEANRITSGSAWIMSQLADCMALCAEDRPAKILFKEAFFIDPQDIDLTLLNSQMIQCLVSAVTEKGYTGEILQEWIPVYGHLLGVFNVKRQLKNAEVVKIKQKIYALENELKDPASAAAMITPRLCNLYFWLIDYMSCDSNESSRISDILKKIKILDPNIYKMYNK